MPIGIIVTMFVRIAWASTPEFQRRNVPWQCEKPNATELHSLPHCLAKPERPRAEGLLVYAPDRPASAIAGRRQVHVEAAYPDLLDSTRCGVADVTSLP